MQEEVNRQVIGLAVSASKMTGRVLVVAIRQCMKNQDSKKVKIYHGKQTLNQLMNQNTALTDIKISNKNIRSFEPYAKKYDIDYALKKDRNANPPMYYVFFKSRDVDVMDMAFKEYTSDMLKRENKPSIRKALVKLKEQAQKLNQNRDREKHKDRDRGAEL